MIITYDDFLAHYGVAHNEDPPGRGSGRFAWGSGENPNQHQFTFLSEVEKLKKQGLKESEIAVMLLGYKDKDQNHPYTSTDLRNRVAIEKERKRQADRQRALTLYNKTVDKYGKGNKSEVARQMGINESQVRQLLNETIEDRTQKYTNTAKTLKQIVEEKGGYVDIGKDAELYLGITENTKKVAIQMLLDEGYRIAYVPTPQMGTTNKTTTMVLVSPNVEYKDVFDLSDHKIQSVVEFTPDNGKTWFVPRYPTSLDSDRVFIRYGDQGGSDRDGTIEIRKGVDDISLGNSLYSQVRIMVDDKAYMKGMAFYSDDIPEGYDLVYNTNKKTGTKVVPDLGEDGCVMKSLKTNSNGEIIMDNPFGALIKAGGQDMQNKSNVINKLQEEGDWDSWGRNLSAQFLSKQPLKLINQQLDLTIKQKQAEYEEIISLTNPIVKQKMLENFAGKCDKAASDLSAVGFKDQAFQVMLPLTTLKDNEVYAPNYKDGDTVCLVRYPHGGQFEIPVLTVNNKSQEGKSKIGNAKDAIGVTKQTLDQLSGADCDGDTSLVIPMASNNLKIQTMKPIKDLVEWDNKENYKLPESAPRMKNSTKQMEMGKVSNLITDMTLQGADINEIVRATKHSMVVIDAEKHHLDYQKSYEDQGIRDLKIKYQGVTETGQPKGASTIISRAGSEAHIPERREIRNTSKMTEEELKRWNEGKIVYRNTGETKNKLVTDPSKMTEEELTKYNAGKKVWRKSDELVTIKVNQMDTVDDAMDLVRDKSNLKEVAYANFANDMKKLANDARKEARSIKPEKVNTQAKVTYANEVESLNQKLTNAKLNNPRERQAQTISNALFSEKAKSNPEMDYEHRQRTRDLCLREARSMTGAGKQKIDITDKEWEAIQSNSISSTKLRAIIDNTDQDKLTKLAMPRTTRGTMTPAQINLAKSMASSGMYTYAEIADRFGVSASYISSLV